jgi:hypothetical protein
LGIVDGGRHMMQAKDRVFHTSPYLLCNEAADANHCIGEQSIGFRAITPELPD